MQQHLFFSALLNKGADPTKPITPPLPVAEQGVRLHRHMRCARQNSTPSNQGTSRRSRNRPFDAVLLRRDGGNREAPPGGWAAPEDNERVLRSVIRAAWPDREPTWPAFLEAGAVLRITDADANNWLPRALRSALAHWCYRRHNPPPPQPQPPHKRRRK